MRLTHAGLRRKDVARHRVSFGRTGLLGIGCLCITGVAILVIWLVCPRDPPDLTACTRVEVDYTHYTQGAIGYFFGWTPVLERVLSEQEQQYVRSFDKWTVTDPQQIRAFAYQIRRGRHRGRLWGKILDVPVDITCYEGRHRVASFRIYRTMPTVVADGHEFTYPPGFPMLRSLDPPGT